jgi:hypothetical protein
MQKERNYLNRIPPLEQYRSRILRELDELCKKIVTLINTKLLPKASDLEAKLYYLEYRGDFLQIPAQFKVGAEYSNDIKEVKKAYEEGMALVSGEEAFKIHPSYLSMVLGYVDFRYSILEEKEEAIKLAQDTFTDAVGMLESVSDQDFDDVDCALNNLKDKLELWTLI